jgi:hypothetical protein
VALHPTVRLGGDSSAFTRSLDQEERLTGTVVFDDGAIWNYGVVVFLIIAIAVRPGRLRGPRADAAGDEPAPSAAAAADEPAPRAT